MAERWIITGQVQRVGYRMSLCREAARLGLTGWVRNRADGSVEAQVQGAPEQVAALMAWARRGPPMARVEGIASSQAPDESLQEFEQRASA
jgi:acylphosphatase